MAVEMLSDSEVLEPKQGGDITHLDMVDERPAPEPSHVQATFAGAAVLLTGGTGFLGKLLVEKLLRSCPDLKKIFLLARPKKNKDIIKRLQEQFDDVLYDRLRKECPDFSRKVVLVEADVGAPGLGLSARDRRAIVDELYDRLRKECPDFSRKVVLVEADVGAPGLGLSARDRRAIVDEVEVILHGAATVRFDEPLKTAAQINVRGTRDMLVLARACSRLKAFVHISTAYSNCVQMEIGEKFYESPLPGDKLIDLVDTLDEKVLNDITPGLLGAYPNTYAYTKAVAEDIVLQYSRGLPVAMFRPSIVIATAKEPIAGWIDNVYGPTGVVVGAAVGLLHVLRCEPRVLADLVPGDMVVGAVLAAACRAARQHRGNHEAAPPADLPPTVYNYVSSEQNPLTWEKFMHYNEVYGFEVPTVQAIYYYLFTLTPSRTLYWLYCLLLHWLPAYVIDAIAVLVGKKPMLRKTYAKITKFSEVMAYFATRQWKFDNHNTKALFNELSAADRELLPFDMHGVRWEDYFHSYIRGVRVYLLKDPPHTVPAGRARLRRLRALHYAGCGLLALLLLRLLWALAGLLLG